jgi:shikimate kinase
MRNPKEPLSIILIGYRCTGKTSVGKKLAERLNIPFYDTDDLIMERLGATIKEIVDQKGWAFFREREKRVVREMAALNQGVAALGGGAILDPENREILKEKGPIVWLTADVQTIIERMHSDLHNADNRPPLSEKDREEEIRAMIALRYPLYEQMTHSRIDTEGKSIEEVTEEIIKKIIF